MCTHVDAAIVRCFGWMYLYFVAWKPFSLWKGTAHGHLFSLLVALSAISGFYGSGGDIVLSEAGATFTRMEWIISGTRDSAVAA